MSHSKRIWGTLDPFFEPGPVLGRKVANVKFLGALLKLDLFDEYHFFLADRRQGNALREHLQKVVPELLEDGRIALFDRRELPGCIARTPYHCFHLSDCITSQPHMARMRNKYSRAFFPVTGTIHSLSYADFGGAFLRHLWPGNTARDAIVCSSRPGQVAVENFFEWLRESYSLDVSHFPAPGLAHIPLGVESDVLTPGEPSKEHAEDGGTIRLLVFGRISHHSKMDLLPLVRALHRLFANGLDPASVELVLAGWAADEDDFIPTLKDYVANAGVCMSLRLRPTEAEKVELFRSADIFVSVADNPQETFGITLVEAGAFGLPVVASDYDGYRDIIIDGETGLLVETIGPDATPDVDVLAPVTFDNQYHLLLAQRTVVEIPALAHALRMLIESASLRRSMGDAARQRIEKHFSWPVVVRQYAALWEELWKRPVEEEPFRDIPHPQALPYGRIFGHYTSRSLSPDMVVRAGRTGEAFYRGKDFPTLYSGMSMIIDPELTKKLVFLARKPVDTGSLIRKFMEVEPTLDKNSAHYHVLWSLKHDILERDRD
ncbi:glycosyltransferase family 4 protein [Pseudodesulfovibrio piezophilus]|uniref:Glycosyl transferase group 1 n=1 Tax=Pseudodesulfovibrio piezophilus (strain DSM 21447 / JCM 15486 / C1TLV30) TaxID=1322246 RepID=M1WR10_PSEP2|nr:glycosyltransferase family 4 protein [Pseudodesulfovibrio piezophilus]CCH49284.1 Glycosyl transferase group 1 [Pseudodesulfovibrio piezophilus C1TLV30]